jgi:hypothetical protein
MAQYPLYSEQDRQQRLANQQRQSPEAQAARASAKVQRQANRDAALKSSRMANERRLGEISAVGDANAAQAIKQQYLNNPGTPFKQQVTNGINKAKQEVTDLATGAANKVRGLGQGVINGVDSARNAMATPAGDMRIRPMANGADTVGDVKQFVGNRMMPALGAGLAAAQAYATDNIIEPAANQLKGLGQTFKNPAQASESPDYAPGFADRAGINPLGHGVANAETETMPEITAPAEVNKPPVNTASVPMPILGEQKQTPAVKSLGHVEAPVNPNPTPAKDGESRTIYLGGDEAPQQGGNEAPDQGVPQANMGMGSLGHSIDPTGASGKGVIVHRGSETHRVTFDKNGDPVWTKIGLGAGLSDEELKQRELNAKIGADQRDYTMEQKKFALEQKKALAAMQPKPATQEFIPVYDEVSDGFGGTTKRLSGGFNKANAQFAPLVGERETGQGKDFASLFDKYQRALAAGMDKDKADAELKRLMGE